MNRLKTLFYLSFRIFSFGRKGVKLSRPLLGSIIGITLSLIPLVVVIHISDGMIRGITERTLETFSYHLQTYPYSTHTIEEMIEQAENLKNLPEVRNATVERQGYGLAYSQGGRDGVTIRAVEEDFYSSDSGVRQYISMEKGLFDISTADSIVIGRDLARKLNLEPGDELKILTGKFFSNGKFLPKVTRFIVKGVFSTGYDELDRMWAFMSLDTGTSILAENSSRAIIGIKTMKPYDNLREEMFAVRDALPKRWGIYTWESLNRSQQENFRTTKMMLIFIMALIVCVAVINISSSLVMLVLEKREEVAVLKCLGASPEDITLSYLITGLLTGITGTVLGTLSGIVISLKINEIISGVEAVLNSLISFFRLVAGSFIPLKESGTFELLNSAYYLDNVPVVIEPDQIIIIVSATLFLSILSSSIPAKRAGRVKPLEVLRKH
ncbi:ABC transporter permease [Spirochaeta isovalerica]|uniref:Lipoprotein-releasing system permease protein n=1 Tax=Spirochaeta isovalerica TaxID=150 RepID=A0A841R864_9SPIO|nr:ABC transporter permease [Spirochaeta isovalerica]MBB6478928.1 lipoprotein-releasing system permease protein [Spirochaeta isovalerica]